jgi:F-type H+-transporting ATPase subunit b
LIRGSVAGKFSMIELPNVTSLYVLLAFGVSYAILKKYLFVPLDGILEAREREEFDAQKAYAQSLQTLEKAVAAGEEKLAAARREALKTREGLRQEGAALLDEKLGRARLQASEEIDRGAKEIAARASELAVELPDRASSLARELAEKILGRGLVA